jgi:hypothetical protein
MLNEVDNNVYNASFVVEDEESGKRYAAFEDDWNGEYYEATACTKDGDLIKDQTIKLYPVTVEIDEDVFEVIGYNGIAI